MRDILRTIGARVYLAKLHCQPVTVVDFDGPNITVAWVFDSQVHEMAVPASMLTIFRPISWGLTPQAHD